jgi:hypothetical protein
MRRTKGTMVMRSMWGGLLTLGLALPGIALANHPVLVEGEQDFDGDGRVGQAENNDGPAGDPLGLTFGTIAGCLGAVNAAIGQNGACQIVTSGNFVEVVNITNQVTIEAAPGVVANIEAFLAPADPRLQEFPTAAADPFALQSAPGIIINSPDDRYVILRNLVVTNWTDGIRIMGSSHVLLDNVRVEHNISNGINVLDQAEVAIRNSQITSTGYRLNPRTGNFPTANPPTPGIGLNFQGNSRGEIRNSVIAGNFDEGLNVARGAKVRATGRDNLFFDNERKDAGKDDDKDERDDVCGGWSSMLCGRAAVS